MIQIPSLPTPTSKIHDSTSVSKAQSVLASNLSAEIPAITISAEGANHPFDTIKEPVNSNNIHTASSEPANSRTSSSPQWCGFNLVGDNVDKKVKPRHMRSDNQSKDLHYFHLYALRDRVDFQKLWKIH